MVRDRSGTLLMPPSIGRKRLKGRLREQVKEIAARNIENLRWAVRQNIENALRTFQFNFDGRVQPPAL